jgi:hypothetical protein
MTLIRALKGLISRPYELLIRRWNWKAAFFSSFIRATIFFCANLKSGLRVAGGAMLAEYVFRALTSGFYGAMTQTLGEVEPEWQACLGAMVLLPVCSHSLEFTVHWLRGTPHLRASMISSFVFTILSTLFNVYAMRRGTMVVGKGQGGILDDLKAFPRLCAGFLSAAPLLVWRALRPEDATERVA